MTSEVAILNKNAVALAADSAVTLRRPGTQKIYNTANKLFMLSKFHPVGIMVYGTAELMGVPWETVIKIYRKELGTANFNKLIEFAQHFLVFLENNRSLFSEQLQKTHLVRMCQQTLSGIQNSIDEATKKEIGERGQIEDEGVLRIVNSIIEERYAVWREHPRLACFAGGFEDELIEKYKDDLGAMMNGVFGRLPIDNVRDKLLQICSFVVTRDWWGDSAGGVVIAGFGRSDIFPVLQCYMVDTICSSRLRYDPRPNQSDDMNESGAASIIPFAQAEMVHRFIRGVDPEYRQELKEFIRNLLTSEYPSKLVEQFSNRLSEEEQRNTRAEMIKLSRGVLSEFDDSWSGWERKKFINPVLDIVGELPKEDLAEMAESLVNLTSFKRRITAEAETVGGPIDVAVISKGDGFVWIKRKHYFKKELNPSFFANYYRRDEQ